MADETEAGAAHVLKPSLGIRMCCLSMAGIFASSAFLQLNDVDWCLWLPLYAIAALVCLIHSFRFQSLSRGAAYVVLMAAVAKFVDNVVQNCQEKQKGHWHLNWHQFIISHFMQKQQKWEMIGSLLVCLCMGLQLDASGGLFPSTKWLMIVSTGIALCTAILLKRRTKCPILTITHT
ncbi:unnamed protein product [Sphagnum balticum]